MEWNQLEYFKTLAHNCHFTRAAAQLEISQPALSRSIARLEREIGVPLFAREGKNVRLSPYGEVFLTFVERSLQEIARGRQAVSDLYQTEQGTVELSFLHSLGAYIIPGLIGEFCRRHAKIRFRLYQNNSHVLRRQLIAGKTDLCLCSPPPDAAEIEWRLLFEEELFIAVPEAHPLAGRSSIALSEIADEPFITFKKNFGFRTLADAFFQAAGIRPPIAFEGAETVAVAGLVDANLGVAMIPRIAGIEHFRIVFLPIRTPRCRRRIGLAWHKERYFSPAAKCFKQFVLDYFAAERHLPPWPEPTLRQDGGDG